jgi:hypothetical protein
LTTALRGNTRGNALHGHARNADRKPAVKFQAPSVISSAKSSGGAAVQVRPLTSERTSQDEIDRRNDAKLLTPLLVMALVIVAGILFYALTGHVPAAI